MIHIINVLNIYFKGLALALQGFIKTLKETQLIKTLGLKLVLYTLFK